MDRPICIRFARTQVAAKAAVKKTMLPWAVRGLLCAKCNRGGGMTERFFDVARHPANLQMVMDYYQLRLGNPFISL